MKREIWIDSFKGVLILLVVLGHSMQFFLGDKCYDNYWWNLIYSFHMPAFMAISGYLQFGKVTVGWGGCFHRLKGEACKFLCRFLCGPCYGV